MTPFTTRGPSCIHITTFWDVSYPTELINNHFSNLCFFSENQDQQEVMRIHSFRVRKFEEVDFEVVDLFWFCRLAGTFFFWGPLIQTVNGGVFFDRVWVIDPVPTGCSGMFFAPLPGLPVIPCEDPQTPPFWRPWKGFQTPILTRYDWRILED